jgi:hypothetical protein
MRGEREYHKHLDASLVPLETALVHRANLLSSAGASRVREAIDKACVRNSTRNMTAGVIADAIADVVSRELRELAEELHYW